ncbi:NINE protein [Campylobacter geochelonis]|uniref:TM2 n=1 Tax=Campylobacter geochelonis TaxID=1780362 RepID=A0A128EE02_9BACT|nr:NINE protein [Campylobacter geochelonis]QKF70476.1 TM2 domain-containing protein [Campylobacter geochelonis]CZE46205.1 TM2 [Campylobacter geochelonis]CZE46423.1 TM2 [Campylobacter geochelonis]CZE50482.1 TM2 [Campylobacter geochelonis]
MRRNMLIAYLLWFFLGSFGAHRIYCGKFISGLFMLMLFWVGSATAWFIIGWFFLAIWGIWWLFDVFLTANMVNDINDEYNIEDEISYSNKIKNIEALYELYQKGAISKAEYETRKDILMRK